MKNKLKEAAEKHFEEHHGFKPSESNGIAHEADRMAAFAAEMIREFVAEVERGMESQTAIDDFLSTALDVMEEWGIEGAE